MIKGKINDDTMKKIEKEFSQISLIQDYLSKTGRMEETYTSIRQADSLELLKDLNIPIKNILLLENSRGITELFNITSTQYSKEQLAQVTKETGLAESEIEELLKLGLELESINSIAESIDSKSLADSIQIKERLEEEIKPEQLIEMAKKGVQVVPDINGGLQVNNLKKLAEIDERGNLELEPKLLESLKSFGVLDNSSNLVIEEIEGREKNQGNTLRASTLEEKESVRKQDEEKKQKMAKDLGIDSDDIVSVIRIDDKEVGSKFYNDPSINNNGTPYVVRTRDGVIQSKFIIVKENEEGKFEKLEGYESTPASRELASLLKDNQSLKDEVALKRGDIRVGKANTTNEDYNYFLIRGNGESEYGEPKNLLYVGTFGDTQMSVIEHADRGERALVPVPVSSVFPSRIYLENNRGNNKTTELSAGEENINSPSSKISFNDINEKKELLQKLKSIENRISEIENKTKPENDKSLQGEYDEELETGEDTKDLNSLYGERGRILKQLGLDESTVINEKDDIDVIRGQNRRPY